MFKPQMVRRHFSLFNRGPHSSIIRSAARDGHDTVVIQRFRIHKPFFSRSRLVGAFAITTAFYCLSKYVGIRVEVERVETEQKNDGKSGAAAEEEDDEDEDDEEDDAILFLPTGFSRPMQQTYYKGSDPEWQEFRKVVVDRPRVDKIRNELSAMLRNMAHKNPSWTQRLGPVDTKKGKAWIELKFPQGPPIEYERPGIELTEDLEWRKSSRPVADVHHRRLNRLLLPTEASNAIYQDTKRKVTVSWNELGVYMGWAEKPPQGETISSVLKAGDNHNPSAPRMPSASATSTTSASTTTPDSKPPADAASPPEAKAKVLGFELPEPKALTLDLAQFQQDFRKALKPAQMTIPRGCIHVLGLVEVYGARARITLNVTAAYDPKLNKYIGLSMTVWNIVEHRQTPKGGR